MLQRAICLCSELPGADPEIQGLFEDALRALRLGGATLVRPMRLVQRLGRCWALSAIASIQRHGKVKGAQVGTRLPRQCGVHKTMGARVAGQYSASKVARMRLLQSCQPLACLRLCRWTTSPSLGTA